MTTTRVHLNDCDIDCTRTGIWGNPFPIGRCGTREEVIEKHMKWFLERKPEQTALRRRLGELRGKRLGCYCRKDQGCHVDFLVDLAELIG